MRVVVAVDGPRASAIASGLEQEGVEVLAVVPSASPGRPAAGGSGSDAVADAVHAADALILEVTRDSLHSDLVVACDRAGVRILPLGGGADAQYAAALFGLEEPRPLDLEAWRIADALAERPVLVARATHDAVSGPRTIVVWGPAGAPGRTTVAIELAVELARGGRRVALVDADSHAPSVAIALGLADEGPRVRGGVPPGRVRGNRRARTVAHQPAARPHRCAGADRHQPAVPLARAGPGTRVGGAGSVP